MQERERESLSNSLTLASQLSLTSGLRHTRSPNLLADAPLGHSPWQWECKEALQGGIITREIILCPWLMALCPGLLLKLETRVANNNKVWHSRHAFLTTFTHAFRVLVK